MSFLLWQSLIQGQAPWSSGFVSFNLVPFQFLAPPPVIWLPANASWEMVAYGKSAWVPARPGRLTVNSRLLALAW